MKKINLTADVLIIGGGRNVKINGENIKLILADAVKKFFNVKILNHVNATGFLFDGEKICGE